MKMIKTVALLLALVSAVCLLPAAALAAAPEDYVLPSFAKTWGYIKEITDEDGETSVWIADGTGETEGIVLHLTDSTLIVDDVTGKPADVSTLAVGDTVYGWYEPYMTMSLPAQSTAVALVVNIPAGHAAGQLVEVASAVLSKKGTLSLAFERNTDMLYLVDDGWTITRFGTNETVAPSEIHPGSRLILWNKEERMVLVDSPYESWVEVGGTTVSVNGKTLSAKAQEKDGETYLPLTSVAKALGYKVYRNAKRTRYTVRKNGKILLTVSVGSDTFRNADGDEVYTSPAFVENGRLYAPISMLATLSSDIWF